MGKRKKNKVKKEEKQNNINKKLIIICAVIVLVAVIICGIFIYQNKKHSNDDTKNQNVEAIIMYSIKNQANAVLNNNQIFTTETTISWLEPCSGTIKKDGKVVSKDNKTILVENGNYEVTVVSANKKDKTVRNFEIDKTPPEVSVEEKTKDIYTIIFENTNDVETAVLTKYDLKTDELIETVDLKENGLQKNIEVKEAGYYILEYTDKVGNEGQKEFEVNK